VQAAKRGIHKVKRSSLDAACIAAALWTNSVNLRRQVCCLVYKYRFLLFYMAILQKASQTSEQQYILRPPGLEHNQIVSKVAHFGAAYVNIPGVTA